MLTETRQAQTVRYRPVPLAGGTAAVKFTGTEREQRSPSTGGEREEHCLTGTELQFGKMNRVLEMDLSDG